MLNDNDDIVTCTWCGHAYYYAGFDCPKCDLHQSVSDLHKEIYGVRPRIDVRKVSRAELVREYHALCEALVVLERPLLMPMNGQGWTVVHVGDYCEARERYLADIGE